MTLIRITGQSSGVQHELATRGWGIGGDGESLHTELVGRAGLALADALHLRSVEGIQLPTALALLLGAELIVPPDVANNAPKADAQNAEVVLNMASARQKRLRRQMSAGCAP